MSMLSMPQSSPFLEPNRKPDGRSTTALQLGFCLHEGAVVVLDNCAPEDGQDHREVPGALGHGHPSFDPRPPPIPFRLSRAHGASRSSAPSYLNPTHSLNQYVLAGDSFH